MNDSTDLYKVLLYYDGTQHSLSATVYAANLFKRIPDMHLTILYVQENISELENYNLWKIMLQGLFEKVQLDQRNEYSKIVAKIDQIFSEKKNNVNMQVIISNPNIPDTVESIIEFATKNNSELIIMGTRGLTSLKGLIYGSLTHSILNMSNIPVLLIKKLPQEFISRL